MQYRLCQEHIQSVMGTEFPIHVIYSGYACQDYAGVAVHISRIPCAVSQCTGLNQGVLDMHTRSVSQSTIIRTLMAAEFPPRAALCSGVRPSLPLKSMWAPLESNGMMTWMLEFLPHAIPSGVSAEEKRP